VNTKCTLTNGSTYVSIVTTLALGSWSRQGHGKMQAEDATCESHSHS